ncbi:hypothetical protein P7C73_g668, partial [Tremellales sp. Uapishka_1]
MVDLRGGLKLSTHTPRTPNPTSADLSSSAEPMARLENLDTMGGNPPADRTTLSTKKTDRRTSGRLSNPLSPRKVPTYRIPLSGSPDTLPPSYKQSVAPSYMDYGYRFAPRYGPPALNTPFSPYTPGEYGRSERGLAGATKVERKLFDDEELPIDRERKGRQREMSGSSGLAPPFEAKMVLRNGASIDLVSWLRTNFHHIATPHTAITPTISLIAIRHLLLERFPRVPESEELSRAVTVAFPHSVWSYPEEHASTLEPPMMKGLVWHGKAASEEEYEPIESEPQPQMLTRARASIAPGPRVNDTSTSRSPTQSSIVSPYSSATKRLVPNTPARSVLNDFAEIAALSEKTPVGRHASLQPEELGAPAPAYALANLCNSTNTTAGWDRKRKAARSPEMTHRRRASTPDRLHDNDKLHGLIAAAEALEGSPIDSVLSQKLLGHKRRRTIGGAGNDHDFYPFPRTGMSPSLVGYSHLSNVQEDGDVDMLLSVERNSAISVTVSEEDAVSTSAPLATNGWARATTSSASSTISHILPSMPGPSRKANELPTNGENPGVDCKPPHPYHEMIRHAIEAAPDRKLQLAQIYSSIADRFPFFKTLDEKKTSGWQNSIRHNLSLKKMFVRVNKVDGVPDDCGGKGGWWTVEPGVPDEGRPGRKAKAKKQRSEDGGESGGSIQPPHMEGAGVFAHQPQTFTSGGGYAGGSL